MFFALDLEELKLNQIYQPLEDSFIFSLVNWNPLQSLQQFYLDNAPQLTLMAANTLIQATIHQAMFGRFCGSFSGLSKTETYWAGVQLGEGGAGGAGGFQERNCGKKLGS